MSRERITIKCKFDKNACCDHQPGKEMSLTSLLLWNINRIIEENKNIDLRSILLSSQKRLDSCCNKSFVQTLMNTEPEGNIICALLAWKHLGHNRVESLMDFLDESCNKEVEEPGPDASTREMLIWRYKNHVNKEKPCCSRKQPIPSECQHLMYPSIKSTVMNLGTKSTSSSCKKKTTCNLTERIKEYCKTSTSDCVHRLMEVDESVNELKQRAASVAKREARRADVLERAAAAWNDLEKGYIKRIRMAEEKELDYLRETEKCLEEYGNYKKQCIEFAPVVNNRATEVEDLREMLHKLEENLYAKTCERHKWYKEVTCLDTGLADMQCTSAQLDRDLQFKEEQMRCKKLTVQSQLDSAQALTYETERVLHYELTSLKEELAVVTDQIKTIDNNKKNLTEEVNQLKTEKNNLEDDLSACKLYCDDRMKIKMESVKEKRLKVEELRGKEMKCRCILPVDAAVTVKRTPSVAALCSCTQQKIADSCSCVSIRTRLLGDLFEDLFDGLKLTIKDIAFTMPCNLLKCFEDTHDWSAPGYVKSHIERFFSNVLLSELEIAIATSIETYHAKWVGATCIDRKNANQRKAAKFSSCNDSNDNSNSLPSKVEELATKIAEKIFRLKYEKKIDQEKIAPSNVRGPPSYYPNSSVLCCAPELYQELDGNLCDCKSVYQCLLDPPNVFKDDDKPKEIIEFEKDKNNAKNLNKVKSPPKSKKEDIKNITDPMQKSNQNDKNTFAKRNPEKYASILKARQKTFAVNVCLCKTTKNQKQNAENQTIFIKNSPIPSKIDTPTNPSLSPLSEISNNLIKYIETKSNACSSCKKGKGNKNAYTTSFDLPSLSSENKECQIKTTPDCPCLNEKETVLNKSGGKNFHSDCACFKKSPEQESIDNLFNNLASLGNAKNNDKNQQCCEIHPKTTNSVSFSDVVKNHETVDSGSCSSKKECEQKESYIDSWKGEKPIPKKFNDLICDSRCPNDPCDQTIHEQNYENNSKEKCKCPSKNNSSSDKNENKDMCSVTSENKVSKDKITNNCQSSKKCCKDVLETCLFDIKFLGASVAPCSYNISQTLTQNSGVDQDAQTSNCICPSKEIKLEQMECSPHNFDICRVNVETNRESQCVCHKQIMKFNDDYQNLEHNTFQLLEEHIKEKMNSYRIEFAQRAFSQDDEKKLYTAIINKIKHVLSEYNQNEKSKYLNNTENSWNRACGLLREYIKKKLGRFSDRSIKNDSDLTDIMDQVCDLIEKDFQKLKYIYTDNNFNKKREEENDQGSDENNGNIDQLIELINEKDYSSVLKINKNSKESQKLDKEIDHNENFKVCIEPKTQTSGGMSSPKNCCSKELCCSSNVGHLSNRIRKIREILKSSYSLEEKSEIKDKALSDTAIFTDIDLNPYPETYRNSSTKHFCDSPVDIQCEESICLKISNNNNISLKVGTTNTESFSELRSEKPLKRTSTDITLNRIISENSLRRSLQVDEVLPEIVPENTNRKEATYVPMICDHSLVPLCHIKMLMKDFEAKLASSECVCDILSSNVCPVHK